MCAELFARDAVVFLHSADPGADDVVPVLAADEGFLQGVHLREEVRILDQGLVWNVTPVQLFVRLTKIVEDGLPCCESLGEERCHPIVNELQVSIERIVLLESRIFLAEAIELVISNVRRAAQVVVKVASLGVRDACTLQECNDVRSVGVAPALLPKESRDS